MKKLKKHAGGGVCALTKIMFFGALLAFSNGLYATQPSLSVKPDVVDEYQQAREKIEGKVVDESGEPLIGVNILVKNSSKGTATDMNGAFSLEVSPSDILVFRYVGYATVSHKVGVSKNIKITMKEETHMMSEVVVVGYGAQKKENLTGAVFAVDLNKTLESRPIADIGRGLQGSVPGLSVVVASGEVGSDPIMKIRGQVGSVEGSTKPLILLDNVEIPSIQLVNPDDIESISVLKDAASTSIYGAKAAFGVILINSKKGAKQESINVTYSNNFSWQNTTKKLEMAGIDGLETVLYASRSRNPEVPGVGVVGNMWRITEESLTRAREWQQKYGGSVKADDPVVYNRDWYVDNMGNKMGVRVYDPIKALVDEWTPTMQHNLSLNGRTGKTNYNVGLGMLDQSGMVKPAKHDDFKRYNASVRISMEVNKFFTARAGAMYSDRKKRYPSQGNVANDPWLYAYRWGPLFPVGVKDQHGNDLQEPARDMAGTTTSSLQDKYTTVNLGATLNFTKNWNLEFDYTYSRQEVITKSSYPSLRGGDLRYGAKNWLDENGNQVYVDADGGVVPMGTEGSVPGYSFNVIDYLTYGVNNSYIDNKERGINTNTFNVYSTYNLDLDTKNKFKFMMGMNRVSSDWEQQYSKALDLLNNDNPQFEYAVGKQSTKGDANWDSQLGFFGRVNYDFDSRYLLEVNLRYDGSSKFPKRIRWKWYPSFSAGWLLTSEKFMQPVAEVLSFAKIRGSYGVIGDQSVNNNLYIPTMGRSTLSWVGAGGSDVYAYGSPDMVSREISWQNIAQTNIGVDLRFLKNSAFGVTFDWYQRDTKDMIIAGEALPATLGVAAPKGNYGNLRTRGWELSFDYNQTLSNGLNLNAMFTLSDSKGKVTKGADHNTAWGDRLISNGWATGATYGDIWGYETDRLYQESDFVRGADGALEKVTIVMNGTARESYRLAGENPVYQTYLEDGGGTVIFRPGDVKYVDINGDGYITPGKGTFGDPGDRKVIGNSLPRYEYGFRLGAGYKGFDVSLFFQGVGKRKIWGSGSLAIPGYSLGDGAMPKVFATDHWTPENTGAFYPRPWDNGGADESYTMKKQSRYLLDMSYLRLKNVTFGYTVAPSLLKKIQMSTARIYMSLENIATWDNLRGLPIDPEVISGHSMFSTNANAGRTAQGTPMFKSVSFGVQIGF